jgi:hypothetical protein
MRKLAVLIATGALALTPTAVAGAKTKHTPCGKHKPHHTNCGKHKAKGHSKPNHKHKTKTSPVY